MSLYDVAKLSGPSAMRPVDRDTMRAAVDAKSAKPADVVDEGVSVETGAKISAGTVPVNEDRVKEIRSALRDGSYPINPAEITDALIAARLMLSVG